jgi:hypothetical protein
MYINPFVASIIATVLVELTALLTYAIVNNIKNNGGMN